MNENENSAMGTEKQEEREIPFPTIGFDTKFRKEKEDKPDRPKTKVVYEGTKSAGDFIVKVKIEADRSIYPITIQIGEQPAKRVILDAYDIVILNQILQDYEPYLEFTESMGIRHYEDYKKEQQK